MLDRRVFKFIRNDKVHLKIKLYQNNKIKKIIIKYTLANMWYQWTQLKIKKLLKKE